MAYGKKIGKYHYMHRSLATHCEMFQKYQSAIRNEEHHISWNVLKLNSAIPGNFSLLHYRSFKFNLFPELIESVIFRNWRYSSKRSYLETKNPKILHRKELLISVKNEHYLNWAKITEILEQIGAFDRPKFIGSKVEWVKILEAKKEQLVGTYLDTYLANNRIEAN